ncbi:hypothetical protein MSZK_42580 [Mycobacterium sp. shizuoka-1]|nr:hypothetical protein MSZK_42580 [Mycobacterium sp. shizuoka-1]
MGNIDTRATNQDCTRNSRQANGRRGIATRTSRDIAKNPPSARNGLPAGADEILANRLVSGAGATAPRPAIKRIPTFQFI